MQRAAFVPRLYPDKIEAYRETHRAVWQEMIDANRAVGIRNHTCFLYENLVVCHLECEDLERTRAALAESDVVRRSGGAAR